MPRIRAQRRLAACLLFGAALTGAGAALFLPQLHWSFTLRDANLGLEIEMVWIKPGSFVMGSPESEDGRNGDETEHRVRLTRGFWLGKTEVTQRQYQAVMGANPSCFRSPGLEAPVDHVTWLAAMDFCKRLNTRERAAGRIPGGYEYSLPTEAQWEYACRAGSGDALRGEGHLDRMAWYGSNGGRKTHPVGQKEPNARGLCDMIGNVWEWCFDTYEDYDRTPSEDPYSDEERGRVSARVLRGGGWFNFPRQCRAAIRSGDSPESSAGFVGFRLALAPVRR